MTDQQIEQILIHAAWIWDNEEITEEDVNKLLRFAVAVNDVMTF